MRVRIMSSHAHVLPNIVLEELPVRLAHRVKELDELPHNISKMPSIIKVKHWYAQSFEVAHHPPFVAIVLISHRNSLISQNPPCQRKFARHLMRPIPMASSFQRRRRTPPYTNLFPQVMAYKVEQSSEFRWNEGIWGVSMASVQVFTTAGIMRTRAI